MRTGRVVATTVALILVWSQPLGVAQAQASSHIKPGGAVTKLGRGVVNIVTGWVELPKRIYETSQAQGAAAGLTWGVLRGLGYGFIRTTAGFYELFTFPFPAPPDYLPLIQPEYIFIDDAQTASPSTNSTYR